MLRNIYYAKFGLNRIHEVFCISAKVKGLMLGCNLDLNERKEYILYKMNKSCKKYEESQYDETVEVDVDQEDVYE